MLWGSASNQLLAMRRLRDRVFADLDDLRQTLLAARTLLLALRDEIAAARGGHPSVDARIAALEARVTALEPPTP